VTWIGSLARQRADHLRLALVRTARDRTKSYRIRVVDWLDARVTLGRRVKLILVCGAWGAGTSAVAGMLANLGAQGFGAYLLLSDPRTPVTYEFIPFRDMIRRLVSERAVVLLLGAEKVAPIALRRFQRRIKNQEFGPYDIRGSVPIFLKYPASALLLPQICSVFDTRLIYVTRSLDDIERTRMRRKWPRQFGRAGAEIIYSAMNRFELLHPHRILKLSFADLTDAPAKCAQALAHFAGLEPDPIALKRAVDFIRPGQTGKASD
jgi:hypothetical protein